ATDIFGLQRMLFASRKGVCLEAEQLRSIYVRGAAKASRRQLSHLVTCATCLDKANDIHGIVALKERYQIDVLGRIPKRSKIVTSILLALFIWSLYVLSLTSFDIDDLFDLIESCTDLYRP